MTTTRRGFLGAILAAGMAPAIVKAEILMPCRRIIVPPPGLLLQSIRNLTLTPPLAPQIGAEYVVFVHPSWELSIREELSRHGKTPAPLPYTNGKEFELYGARLIVSEGPKFTTNTA